MEFDCNYGEAEFRTVEAGIGAIQTVFAGDDLHAKERLLYYLDWYMDPYYKTDCAALYEPLKELLQNLVVSDSNFGIAEEALHLLESYTDGPYPILKQNADSVPEELKPTVLYLVNTDNR